jgi:hypothetical protein
VRCGTCGCYNTRRCVGASVACACKCGRNAAYARSEWANRTICSVCAGRADGASRSRQAGLAGCSGWAFGPRHSWHTMGSVTLQRHTTATHFSEHTICSVCAGIARLAGRTTKTFRPDLTLGSIGSLHPRDDDVPVALVP